MSSKSTITCDLEGVIETYNEGAAEIFGYTPEEVIGKKRVSLFSPGLIVLGHVERWLRVAREERIFEGKTVFVRKDGTRFPAHIRITPTYRDGVQIGYCGVTEPIEETVHVPISWATKVLSWLVVTRAPFLTAAIMPVLIGGAYAAGALPTGQAFPTGLFLLTLFGVMLLHLASNVFNDYFDWKRGTDQVNATYFLKYSGGSRAIELGLIDLAGTWRLAWVLLATAVAIGLFLTWNVGTGVLALGLTGAALGYFYTAPPVRLVARHGLGELAIGLAFGPLITLGTAYVVSAGADFSWQYFVMGIPVGLLTANILVINQIPDVEADASTGKNHLVVTLGARRTPYLYGAILGVALLVHLFIAATWAEATWLWWLPGVLLAGYGAYIIQYMIRHLERRTLVHANIQTIQLNIVYGLLFAAVIVFG